MDTGTKVELSTGGTGFSLSLQKTKSNPDAIGVWQLGNGIYALDTNQDNEPTQADFASGTGDNPPLLKRVSVSDPNHSSFTKQEFIEAANGWRYNTVSVPLPVSIPFAPRTLHLALNKVGWASTLNRAVNEQRPDQFDTLLWGSQVLVNAPYFYDKDGIEKRFEEAVFVGYLSKIQVDHLIKRGHDVSKMNPQQWHTFSESPHRHPLPLSVALSAATGDDPLPLKSLLPWSISPLPPPRGKAKKLRVRFPDQPVLNHTQRPFDALSKRNRWMGITALHYQGLSGTTPVALGREVGPSQYFETADAALTYAQGYPKASVVLKDGDGRFHVYTLQFPYYLQNENLANVVGSTAAAGLAKAGQYLLSSRTDTTGFAKKGDLLPSNLRLALPQDVDASVIAVITSDLPTLTKIDETDGKVHYGILPNYRKKEDPSQWQRMVLTVDPSTKALYTRATPIIKINDEKQEILLTVEAISLAKHGYVDPLLSLPPDWIVRHIQNTPEGIETKVAMIRALLQGPTVDAHERAILKVLTATDIQAGKQKAHDVYTRAARGKPISDEARDEMTYIANTIFPIADFSPELAQYQGLSCQAIFAKRWLYFQQRQLLQALAQASITSGKPATSPTESLLARLEMDLDGENKTALRTLKKQIEDTTQTHLSESVSSFLDAAGDGIITTGSMFLDMANMELWPIVAAFAKGFVVLVNAELMGDPEAQKKLAEFCNKAKHVFQNLGPIGDMVYEASIGKLVASYHYHKHNGSLVRFWTEGGVVLILNLLFLKGVPGFAQLGEKIDRFLKLPAAARAGGILTTKDGRIIVNPTATTDLAKVGEAVEELVAHTTAQIATGTQAAKATKDYWRLFRDLQNQLSGLIYQCQTLRPGKDKQAVEQLLNLLNTVSNTRRPNFSHLQDLTNDLESLLAQHHKTLPKPLVTALTRLRGTLTPYVTVGTRSTADARELLQQLSQLRQELNTLYRAANSTGNQSIALRYGQSAARRIEKQYNTMSKAAKDSRAQAIRDLWKMTGKRTRLNSLIRSASTTALNLRRSGATSPTLAKLNVHGILVPAEEAMLALQNRLLAMQALLPQQWPQTALVSLRQSYFERLQTFNHSLKSDVFLQKIVSYKADTPIIQSEFDHMSRSAQRLQSQFENAQRTLDDAYSLYDKAQLGEHTRIAIAGVNKAQGVAITRSIPETWQLMMEQVEALTHTMQELEGIIRLHQLNGSNIENIHRALAPAFQKVHSQLQGLPDALNQERYDQFMQATHEANKLLTELEHRIYF